MSATSMRNRPARRSALSAGRERDRPARRRVPARVVEEVREQPDEPGPVGVERREPGRGVDDERDAGPLERRPVPAGHVTGELADRHRPPVQDGLGGGAVEDAQLEEVADERAGVPGLAAGVGESATGVGGAALGVVALGLVEERAEGGERGAEVVAHVGDELAAEPVGRLQLADAGLDARRHLVDGPREPAQLVVRRDGQAGGVVAGADPLDAARDLADGPDEPGRKQGPEPDGERDGEPDRHGHRPRERRPRPGPLLGQRPVERADEEGAGREPVRRQQWGEPPRPVRPVQDHGHAARLQRVDRRLRDVGRRPARAERSGHRPAPVEDGERVGEPRGEVGAQARPQVEAAQRADGAARLDLLSCGVEPEPERPLQELLGSGPRRTWRSGRRPRAPSPPAPRRERRPPSESGGRWGSVGR